MCCCVKRVSVFVKCFISKKVCESDLSIMINDRNDDAEMVTVKLNAEVTL